MLAHQMNDPEILFTHRKDNFDRAAKVTAGLAEAFGRDIWIVAHSMGRGLVFPNFGVLNLSRAGFPASPHLIARIADLVERDAIEEARSLLLDEWEKGLQNVQARPS